MVIYSTIHTSHAKVVNAANIQHISKTTNISISLLKYFNNEIGRIMHSKRIAYCSAIMLFCVNLQTVRTI